MFTGGPASVDKGVCVGGGVAQGLERGILDSAQPSFSSSSPKEGAGRTDRQASGVLKWPSALGGWSRGTWS